MEKRMPSKSPQLPEGYPSGCRWGLTRLFKLFNGNSHRKLISNLSQLDRHKRGDDQADALPASDKKCRDDKKLLGIYHRIASARSLRRGKRDLHSRESLAEKNNINDGFVHRGKDAKYREDQKPDYPRTGRHRFSHSDSSGNMSRWALSDVFCGHGCRNVGCVNNGATGTRSARLSETVANGKTHNSKSDEAKRLLEALQILYSNEELLVKLLEDPKFLLGRRIEDLWETQGRKEGIRQFTKLCEVNSTSGARKGSRLNPLNKIVILKPQQEWRAGSKMQINRQACFPSRRLRRKLKWAQLKRYLLSNGESEAVSACRHDFKDKTGCFLKEDCETRRKHLIELLNWSDGMMNLSQPREKLQRNLRRSISLPEYDFFSNFFCHERSEHGSEGAQMRYFPYSSSYRVKNDSKLRPLRETNRAITSIASASGQSGGPEKSNDFNVMIESQGTVTTPMHTSSEESTEAGLSQLWTSSSPEHSQATENPAVSSKEDDVKRISFDESHCMELSRDSGPSLDRPDIRSANDFIKAVLLAADLNWDILIINNHESGRILQLPLLDEVKVAHDGNAVDQRLLFDYINEVLEGVYRCYKANLFKFRTSMAEKDVNHAVMKRVNRDGELMFQNGSPTLETLMYKDLTRCGTWIDIPGNIEEIAIELVDDILDDVLSEI